MSLSRLYMNRLNKAHKEYVACSKNKESLLKILNEVEIVESVYNSNAIENSTLTIDDTENILLYNQIAKHMELREVYEAKNLAIVMEYIQKNIDKRDLTLDLSNFLHSTLLSGIRDDIKGRTRMFMEYVKVGPHVAPAPEKVIPMITEAFDKIKNTSISNESFIERLARFHLEFETVHPYIDGNGRIGRVLVNFVMMKNNFPPIIVRNKEKQNYYRAFRAYNKKKTDEKEEEENDINKMSDIFYLMSMESLHKRLAYLKSMNIITLAKYAEKKKRNARSLLNSAKKQTIPAFRERGIWKIGAEHNIKLDK